MADFIVEPLEKKTFSLPQFTTTFKILLIAVGILIAGGGGYVLFSGSSFSESNVVVVVNGPSEATTGDRVSYKVTYANNNTTALTNARLVFYYPPESIPLKDGAIKTQLSESIDLGTINAKAGGELVFEAIIIGRPYRNRASIREALDEIVKNKGTQFDPKIVDVFVSVVEKDGVQRFLKNVS